MNNGKKKILYGLIFFMSALWLLSVPVFAKPSAKTVKKAFLKYITRYIGEAVNGDEKYYLADLNKDSVKECMVQWQQGMKTKLIILQYKNKKVKVIFENTGVEEIHYSKKKNRVCIDYSSGAADHDTVFYKLVGSKLKKKDEYTSRFSYEDLSVTYKHGKKVITEQTFLKKLNSIRDTWKDVTPFSKGKIIP